MPNLPGLRIRENGAFGTITDNPLSAGAVTFNSPGLSKLRAISSDHAIVVLDPLRQTGDPEIVMITSHASAATVATIQRGMYGTSPRVHGRNTLWVNAATNDDFIRTVTSSTRPSDTFEGQLIYETDTNIYKTWDGTTWNNLGGLPSRLGWHVRRAAVQAVNANSLTAISWDTEVQDIPDNFTPHATTGTTLTIPTGGDGLWSITLQTDGPATMPSMEYCFNRIVAGGFTFQQTDSDDIGIPTVESQCLTVTVPLVATNTIVASVQHSSSTSPQNFTGRLLAYRIGN